MRNSLLVLVLLAASLLADAWSDVSCGSDGSYTANSTYEANLRRLAADLPAEAAASPGRFAERSIGFWPNRVRATSSCRSAGDGDCAACIAHAFERVKVVCAFHKEAAFYSRDCSIHLDEVRVFGSDLFEGIGTDLLVWGMIFQGLGLVCLFLMFLGVLRHDTKKGVTPLIYPKTSKSVA